MVNDTAPTSHPRPRHRWWRLLTAGAVLALTTTTVAAAPAHAAPRLTLAAPFVHAGKSGTVTATLTGVPAGQGARITVAGLNCAPTKLTRGTARTNCTFRPRAVGGYTLTATATRYARGKTVARHTTAIRTTALGVATTVAATVHRGERTTLRFTIGAGWAPGTRLRLTPGITGATGCPSTLNATLSSQRTVTFSCAVTPQPAAALKVAPTVRAGARGLMTGPVTTRPVLDGRPLSATVASARWKQQSQALWDLSRTLPPAPSHDAASTGFELRLLARRDGWDSPAVTDALEHLLQLRNSDGGWGVQVAWDAFGNGTINPADTSYTVTTAEHVGPALLEAWDHDLVSDEDLRAAVDSVMAAPTWKVTGGRCIGYSSSRNDAGLCVPNVSMGAAAWLKDVRNTTGWVVPGLNELVADVTTASRYQWNPTTGYWSYSDMAIHRGRPQDARHQGYTIQSALTLDPKLGHTASALVLANPWWRQPTRGPVSDFGNGLSQIAFANCRTAALAPSVLDAHAVIRAVPTAQQTRFLALQGALYGYRTYATCFTSGGW